MTERVDPLDTLKLLGRTYANDQAQFGSVDDYGRPVTAPEPSVDPDALNQKWGIKGSTPETSLSFKGPLPESVAQDMNAAKRDEIARQSAQQRSPGGAISALGDFGFGMLDPVGIAASAMPVFGEARIAAMLGRAGIDFGEGAAGQIATRAATGAIDATAANAPLVAARYGLSQQEQSDYSMTDAARDLAFGALLGGVLHPAIGAVTDALHGFVSREPGPVALDNDPQTRGAMMTAGVAATMEDRPFDASMFTSLAEARAHEEAMGVAALPGEPDITQPIPGETAGASPYMAVPSAPKRLNQFLREPQTVGDGIHATVIPGGIQDVGGDIEASIGEAPNFPGLINKSGRPLDNATLHAWEAGYFPEHSERPDINHLLDAIAEDHNGNPRYSMHDQAAIDARSYAENHNSEIDRLSSETGIDPKGMTRDQFLSAVGDYHAQIQQMEERGRIDDIIHSDMAERARDNLSTDDEAVLRQVEQVHAMPAPKPGSVPHYIADQIAKLEADLQRTRSGGVEPSEVGAEEGAPISRLHPDDEAALNEVSVAEQGAMARAKAFLQAGACIARGLI